MDMRANGTFDVKLTPQLAGDRAENTVPTPIFLEKQFHGDLEATSTGQMLSAMSSVKGSAGYVAIEVVTGTLQGRAGTFVLQHNGTMTRGVPQLSVNVVPDSGTGELAGLAGSMTIKVEDGKYSYYLEYSLLT
jgi:Protein of unknown function (DUF3224)